MLPLIGGAVIYLRYTRLPREILPNPLTTMGLWLSTAVMAGFALYYVGSRML
jgi:hypothetical protein